MRKTKIVCTIGPASSSAEMLEKLVDSGMNVARLNFSHGSYESHQKVIDTFKSVRNKLGKPISLLLDTKGPEIRVGKFKNDESHYLMKEDTFILTTEEILGTKNRVSVSYKNLPNEVKVGQRIVIDDGKIELRVAYIEGSEIVCTVTASGMISNNKGVNIPHTHLNMPYLSPKDKDDIRFGVYNDVDFIAASFVRTVDDVKTLRKFLNNMGGKDIKIISKIENLEGIENFDAILDASDGIMIARGDMGVEVEFEKIPGIQKQFIKKCREVGKMVITATQMLESMTHSKMPTRAEITDVANAVFDGTSAVMLSGETAMGDHPDLVVKAMSNIVVQAEKDFEDYAVKYKCNTSNITNAICDAACITARDLEAKCIVAVTKSGETARLVSKYRPKELIVAPTPDKKTFNQLGLSWGVYPIFTTFQYTEEDLITNTIDELRKANLVIEGDIIILTAGIPESVSGTTNSLKVIVID